MKERKEKRGFLYYLIPIVLTICLLVSGGLFLRDFTEYLRADREYASLNDLMETEESSQEEAAAEKETESEDASEEGKGDYPALHIDYDGLSAINPDFSSVLFIPALELRYPVAASKDNADYLHKTFEGKANYAGCIFLDSNAKGSYDYANTFLFGHNMKNGSMFGKLKNFIRDPELAESDPYIYLYRKDWVGKYRIFSYYNTTIYSPAYQDFEGEDGYRQYIKRALSNSAYQNYPKDAVDFEEFPRILTLSTCAGRSGSEHRMLVHAALIEEWSGKGE